MGKRIYVIEAQFNGKWGVMRTAETMRDAETLCQRISWPTRIYSLPYIERVNA